MRMILDCDDVLLDYTGGFLPWICQRHGVVLPDQGVCISALSEMTGLTLAQVSEGFAEFNSGRIALFEELSPLPGARETLKTLLEQGWDLQVVTAAASHPAGVAMRLRHLKACFGQIFSNVICLDLGASKFETLSGMPPSVFVDDLPGNVESGIRAGHQSYLMTASHNLHEKTLPRVRDWRHIAELAHSLDTTHAPGL